MQKMQHAIQIWQPIQLPSLKNSESRKITFESGPALALEAPVRVYACGVFGAVVSTTDAFVDVDVTFRTLKAAGIQEAFLAHT